MKTFNKIAALTIFTVALTITSKAQQGFGTSNPAPSSVVDMVSSSKGALLPRVLLTSTTVAAPVIAPADALTVFNTNTAGDVTPGYYYWSASPAPGKWVRLLTSFTQDLRLVGTASHITVDAGIGSNGTTMPGSHNIAIGAGAMKNAAVGPSPFGLLGNIAIGGGDQLAKVTGPSNVAIGYGNIPNGTGGGNIGIGGLNLTSVTTGEGNYAIGVESQQAVTTGAQNISLGSNVLKASTGNKNIGMGNDVLKVLATGNDNVGFGVVSGSALTAGNYNTFFGTEAGNRITGPATDRYTSGDFSLFLGSQTKAQSSVSNQLNIQNYIYGVNGSLAFGDFTGGNPLITPTARLDVTQGNVRVRDITAAYTLLGTDRMVVADNTGVLRSVPTSTFADINIYKNNGIITAGDNRTVTIPDGTNLNFTGQVGGSVYTFIDSGTIGLYAYENNGVIEISTEGGNSDITLNTKVTGSDVLLQPQAADKFVGIGTVSPTEKLDIGVGNVRVRSITAAHTLAATDKVVIADNTGVLKTVSSVLPKFFYAPSVVIPTHTSAGVVLSGTQTLDVYTLYAQQFGFSAGAGQARSNALSNLPVLPANQLDYFITYFDTNVFNTVTISTAGVISYTVKPTAVVTEAAFMNIVFKVKD